MVNMMRRGEANAGSVKPAYWLSWKKMQNQTSEEGFRQHAAFFHTERRIEARNPDTQGDHGWRNWRAFTVGGRKTKSCPSPRTDLGQDLYTIQRVDDLKDVIVSGLLDIALKEQLIENHD